MREPGGTPTRATRLVLDDSGAGERFDAFAATAFVGLTRSQAQRHIEAGRLTLNGKAAAASTKLKPGDVLDYDPPAPEPAEPIAQDIPLDILYEDDDLCVLNKPPGLVVHPAAGHADGTLVNGLLFHMKGLSGIGGVLRPGIVHRLDRDTSGVMVVTKNDAAHAKLARFFAERKVHKVYHAIVYGTPRPAEGVIDAPIGRHPEQRLRFTSKHPGPDARTAQTAYRVLASDGGVSLVECRPKTGRTHQIRVHLADHHWPIAGDFLYCAERRIRSVPDGPVRKALEPLHRQALHASGLMFNHPVKHTLMRFVAPLPADMAAIVAVLAPGVVAATLSNEDHLFPPYVPTDPSVTKRAPRKPEGSKPK